MSGRATFEEVVSLRERLAAAEQRAKESEARAERLAAACKIGLGVIVRSDLKGKEPRDAIAALTDALTAAATQPDERAAAERAVTQRVRELLPYLPDTADPYAYQEASEGVYIIRWRITREGAGAIDNVIDAMQSLDAADGAI